MNRREIRSYVIREGRMTDGQRRALTDQWSSFGLDLSDGEVDPASVFGNDHPTVVEIGFGMGDSLIETAMANPDMNYIGVEVHRPGVGHLLIKAAELGLSNIRVFNADSVDVVENCIPDNSIDRIQVFFPDPWHKKRHHKRRLINEVFARKLASRLKPGGILHIATDWPDYAEAIEEACGRIELMRTTMPPARCVTKYERRGKKLGHPVFDLAWERG